MKSNIYNKEFSKKFAIPSIANEEVTFPLLKEIIGNFEGKKIFEIGCGNRLRKNLL